MANVSRRCTECGTPIVEGSRASLCSPRCRSRKSRRVKAAKSRAGSTPRGGYREEWEVYDSEQHEIARKVAAKELTPYVREQISDDVIKAIGGMMGLTAKVVQTLEHDLEHPDPQVRMKAAALVAKYSMPEKFMPAGVGGENEVTVRIDVPSPEAEANEPIRVKQTCDVCGEEKNADELVGGSSRCVSCYNVVRDQAKARLLGA